ncbi:hypothetical protein [Desulfuromonas sp. TF]|uniref:hypothetical protein n=1 Tax=Desulfuromonas sp. TF TaxID=1232410 RepID=UPI0004075B91|nr:hypothetical protein [Desulfuromonas sp. TF]
MSINFIKQAFLAIAIIFLCSGVAFGAQTIFDWNESGTSGTTWPGWTWSNDTNGYGGSGWRKNDGKFYYGDSGWFPRAFQKSDYGNDSIGTIVQDRAPSTESGGSLKVYDTGKTSVYQAGHWFQWGKNFSSQGLATNDTDRLDFYFKPVGISNSGLTSDPNNGNIHFGTYLCWDGGGLGGESCPKEANNQHYYHMFTVNSGTWLHMQLNRHPQHQRGMKEADKPDDNPSPYNYFSVMNSFYLEIRYPNSSKTYYILDEVKLSETSQPENDISINSVWVGYWPESDKWEIGFMDDSFNATGYNSSSQSTFEVRYSTSPITNANYAQATVAEPEYWERGTTNKFRRPNSWKKPAWTRFTIPNSIEQSVNRIYFAIKDVSSTANGDGHNAPSSLIHTIDYDLKPGTDSDSAGGTPPKPVANLRIIN